MASNSIRKPTGAVKNQTSISLATVAYYLEFSIVKATSPDNEPADEAYVRDILNFSYTRRDINTCVSAISKRLSKTRDWIVALKALMLVHRLLNDGGPVLQHELTFARRKGKRVLDMTDFRDETHLHSWDHSGFVRKFALYLDKKLEFMVSEWKLRVRPIKALGPEKVLDKLNELLRLLDLFLACRPKGAAKNTKLVLVALYILVKESFRLYADISDLLLCLFDSFSALEYDDSLEAFDAYVNAAKMIDELAVFYSWCKDEGVAKPSEFPNVHRINDELLGKLEALLREKRFRRKSTNKTSYEEINYTKALPPPENYNPDPPKLPQPRNEPQNQKPVEDLVDLKDHGESGDERGNNLALVLFSGETNGEWVDFSADEEKKVVASPWDNPAADIGKADWERELVESASILSKQHGDLGGGFNRSLLYDMYDQGTARQHVINSGSASSVALPKLSENTTPVLALPAPDGAVRPVGQEDPFAASLSVPPPAYVQIDDRERKQRLLNREQQLWQQYSSDGMRGQIGMGKIGGNGGYYDAAMPYRGYYAS